MKGLFPKSIGIYINALFFGLINWAVPYYVIPDFSETTRLVISIGAGLGTFVSLVGIEVIGVLRHRRAISSKHYQALIDSFGFEIVRLGDYYGLQGEFNGYAIDVYFDWNAPLSGKSSSAHVISAYYHPISIRDDGTPDYYKSGRLHRKYFKWFSWKVLPKFSFTDQRVDMYTYFSNSKNSITQIDQLIEKVQAEGLRPANMETVSQWRIQKIKGVTPQVETYPEYH